MIHYIRKEYIDTAFNAKDKRDAIRRMAAFIIDSKSVSGISAQDMEGLIAEREALGSTGLGNGIAIPHARIKGLRDFVVLILIAPKGVHYDSLDKKKVNLFFVVLAPEEKVSEHLKLLAWCSRLLSNPNFRREILQCANAEIVYETLTRFLDGAGAPKAPRQTMKLMILVLYYDEFLYDILEFLMEENVEGATIIESAGMGTYVSQIPLFAGFLSFMREDKNKSKVMLSVFPADMQSRIVEGIEAITGDLDKKQGAMIMLLDLPFVKGTMEIV